MRIYRFGNILTPDVGLIHRLPPRAATIKSWDNKAAETKAGKATLALRSDGAHPLRQGFYLESTPDPARRGKYVLLAISYQTDGVTVEDQRSAVRLARVACFASLNSAG